MKKLPAFSLVEMLVALSIAGGALTLTGALVADALRARTAAAHTAFDLDRTTALNGALARLLRDASPAARRADQADGVLFDGDAQRIRWVTTSWGHALPAGLYEVECAIAQENARATLRVQIASFDAARYGAADGGAVETASVAAGARFAFAGRDADGGLRWRDAWSAREGWPVAVSIAFDENAAPLIVPLPQPGAPR